MSSICTGKCCFSSSVSTCPVCLQSSHPSLPGSHHHSLCDFPVSTDTQATRIPKQFVLISLLRLLLWSVPPLCLWLLGVPSSAPSVTVLPILLMLLLRSLLEPLQPQAWLRVSHHSPAPASSTSRLFNSVEHEESASVVLVI